ncbi:MAG: radical SAM protein [Polyangiaceae bacterium]|jgi:MoaA/NifB/PqqE/SkfB family radical SAM enzyme
MNERRRYLVRRVAGEGDRAVPGIQRLTLMLTESCNLDCWMCDFGKRNRRIKNLPLSVDAVLQLLDHPVFAASLASLTCTGGEPFLFPEVEELYTALQTRKPELKVHFSSNTTALGRMIRVFDTVRDWSKLGLFTSVDGIEMHDIQRGVAGAFQRTMENLDALRTRYPALSIHVKYTITPMNYTEVARTFDYVHSRGYVITAKMIENNPYYTNNLTHTIRADDFSFTDEQIEVIRTQLRTVLANWPRPRDRRRAEVEEALASLDPEWRRDVGCLTPQRHAFIDCDLNFFTCKEYGPVANLAQAGLDVLGDAEAYYEVLNHERANTGHCTRCTSHLKMNDPSRPSRGDATTVSVR